MPTDLPQRFEPDMASLDVQAALLSDALGTEDAFLVSHMLRDIAASKGQRADLGDNPPLGMVLAAVAALGLELSAKPRG